MTYSLLIALKGGVEYGGRGVYFATLDDGKRGGGGGCVGGTGGVMRPEKGEGEF